MMNFKESIVFIFPCSIKTEHNTTTHHKKVRNNNIDAHNWHPKSYHLQSFFTVWTVYCNSLYVKFLPRSVLLESRLEHIIILYNNSSNCELIECLSLFLNLKDRQKLVLHFHIFLQVL